MNVCLALTDHVESSVGPLLMIEGCSCHESGNLLLSDDLTSYMDETVFAVHKLFFPVPGVAIVENSVEGVVLGHGHYEARISFQYAPTDCSVSDTSSRIRAIWKPTIGARPV